MNNEKGSKEVRLLKKKTEIGLLKKKVAEIVKNIQVLKSQLKESKVTYSYFKKQKPILEKELLVILKKITQFKDEIPIKEAKKKMSPLLARIHASRFLHGRVKRKIKKSSIEKELSLFRKRGEEVVNKIKILKRQLRESEISYDEFKKQNSILEKKINIILKRIVQIKEETATKRKFLQIKKFIPLKKINIFKKSSTEKETQLKEETPPKKENIIKRKALQIRKFIPLKKITIFKKSSIEKEVSEIERTEEVKKTEEITKEDQYHLAQFLKRETQIAEEAEALHINFHTEFQESMTRANIYLSITTEHHFIIGINFSNYPERPVLDIPPEIFELFDNDEEKFIKNIPSYINWNSDNPERIIKIIGDIEIALMKICRTKTEEIEKKPIDIIAIQEEKQEKVPEVIPEAVPEAVPVEIIPLNNFQVVFYLVILTATFSVLILGMIGIDPIILIISIGGVMIYFYFDIDNDSEKEGLTTFLISGGKKKISVDVDGVLINYTERMCQLLNKKYGKNYEASRVREWDWYKKDGITEKQIEDVFREIKYATCAEQEPNINEFLEEINKIYNCEIVTIKVDGNKRDLINRLKEIKIFRGTHYNRLNIIVGKDKKKWELSYDIYIDDSPELAVEIIKRKDKLLLLYDQPWNGKIQCERYANVIRVKNWREINETLKKYDFDIDSKDEAAETSSTKDETEQVEEISEEELQQRFEKETGKNAVWRGKVTRQYLQWKKTIL